MRKPKNFYKKYHYVYLTTNLINGKQYVGDHSTDNLNDKYMGSGILLVAAIKKYGKENFKKEILENFNSRHYAFKAQKKYIKKFKTISPNGYNLHRSGGRNPQSFFNNLEEMNEYIEKINNTHCGIDDLITIRIKL